MEAHSANILRKSGRGASREGIFYVRAAAHPERGVYVRAGAGRWERRGPAGSSCSGGAGIEPPCPDGAGRISMRVASVSERGWSLLRAGRRRLQMGPVASPCGAPVPAWTLSSGGAGMEPPPFPDGAGRISVRSPCSGVEPLFRRGGYRAAAVSGRAGRISVRSPCSGVDPLFRRGRHGAAAVSGRAGRIPRTQGLPSSRAAPSGRGPMLRFRTLFVLFCSVPPRRNRRRLQIRGFAAREKRKSCFFIFTL